MKKIFTCLIVVMIFTTIKSYSQTVNGIPFKDLNLEYVQIWAYNKSTFGTKFIFTIDVGNPPILQGKDNSLKDSSGNKIIFSNLIDAMNFLNNEGYDYVETYSMPNDKDNVYYLMKKRDEPYYKDDSSQ